MLIATSALLALLPFAIAQTSTSCDPTKQSCPADPGYDVATTTYNFQTTSPGADWTVLGNGELITQDSSGLHFTIDASGQAPTLASTSISSLVSMINFRIHLLWKYHRNTRGCAWRRYCLSIHLAIGRS
jgi:hypothetical protein